MPRISDLPALATPADDDELAIVDDSASATKKITLTGLKDYLQTLLGWIATPMIADGAVTAVKIEDQEEWTDATYLNSWVTYNTEYGDVRYMKDSMGFVHIDGMCKSGTINTPIFNLPAGYRPTARQLRAIQSGSALARLDITAAGDVIPINGNNAWVALHGLTFKADQ